MMFSSRSLSQLLLFSLLAASSAAAATTLDFTFPSTPPAENTANVVIKDNFFGLSFEMSSFPSLGGDFTNGSALRAKLNYLTNLKAPQIQRSDPLAADLEEIVYSRAIMMELFYNNTAKSVVRVANIMIGAALDEAGNILQELPPDLAEYLAHHPFEQSWPRSKDAKRILDRGSDTVVVLFEPGLFAKNHVRDGFWLLHYLFDQIKNAGLTTDDDTFVAVPGIRGIWTLDRFLKAAGLDKFPHKYYRPQQDLDPNHTFDGYKDKNTNLTHYTQHSTIREYVTVKQSAVNTAAAKGVKTLLTEYNTAACGGTTNISDTFTATLWALDAGLQAAATNYSAVRFHTREHEHGARSNLSNWRTSTTYHSGLVLAEVFSSTGSVVADLSNSTKVDPGSGSSSSSFRTDETAVYGVYDNGGSKQGKLVLINYTGGGKDKEPVTFKVPSSSTASTRAFAYRVLSASSSTASRTPNSTEEELGKESLITWAGQFVGENGKLVGDQVSEEIKACSSGDCTVEVKVPSPGAVMVLFDADREDVFYEGNSTSVTG